MNSGTGRRKKEEALFFIFLNKSRPKQRGTANEEPRWWEDRRGGESKRATRAKTRKLARWQI